jgi:hypothetical protein
MKGTLLVMVKSLFVVSQANVPVDEQETYLRQNFNKSNNINYRDGDKQSSKYYNFGESESDDADKKLTKCIIHLNIVTTDSLGSMVRKYDKSSKRTTLK